MDVASKRQTILTESIVDVKTPMDFRDAKDRLCFLVVLLDVLMKERIVADTAAGGKLVRE